MRGKVAKALRRSVFGKKSKHDERHYTMIGWNSRIKPNLSAGIMRRIYIQAKKVYQKNGL